MAGRDDNLNGLEDLLRAWQPCELRRLLTRAFGAGFAARLPDETVGVAKFAFEAREALFRDGWPEQPELWWALAQDRPARADEIRGLAARFGAPDGSALSADGDAAPALRCRYRRVEAIDEGAFSVVYRGTDADMQQEEVAIKLLKPCFSQEPVWRERLLAEASALRRLSHPNLVRVFHAEARADASFIVMEYLHGGTVAKRIKDAPLTLDEACRIALAVLDALAAVHARGLVHRDVSPRNVLFDARGAVRLGDFGLARVEGNAAGSRSIRHGTPGFSAPEQANGDPTDRRADLYAVGALLVAMLTGNSRPKDLHVTLGKIADRLPGPVLPVLERALRYDPEERFPDAAAIKDALVEALESPRARTFSPSDSEKAAPSSVPHEGRAKRASLKPKSTTRAPRARSPRTPPAAMRATKGARFIAPAPGSDTFTLGWAEVSVLDLVLAGLALPMVPISEVIAGYTYDLSADGRWLNRSVRTVLRVEVDTAGAKLTVLGPGVRVGNRFASINATFALHDGMAIGTPEGPMRYVGIDHEAYRGAIVGDHPVRLPVSASQTVELGREPKHPGFNLPDRTSQDNLHWLDGPRARRAREMGFTLDKALTGRRHAAVTASAERIEILPVHETLPTYVLDTHGQVTRLNAAWPGSVGDLLLIGTTIVALRAPVS